MNEWNRPVRLPFLLLVLTWIVWAICGAALSELRPRQPSVFDGTRSIEVVDTSGRRVVYIPSCDETPNTMKWLLEQSEFFRTAEILTYNLASDSRILRTPDRVYGVFIHQNQVTMPTAPCP